MNDQPSAEFLSLQEAVAGRYFLERELGRGGMGIVYLARDVSLDRMVAIKLLPPDLAHSGELRSRFLREARTAAQLSHPHIVPIHAVEEHDALVFFVMELVDGETLGARIRRGGPLGPAEAMRLMQEVAWALAHAHSRGIIHRDIKPDNILIERDTGRALVTDFGIARATEAHTPAGGIVVGTPQYMSPEQSRGESMDGRSDLYSLGATFFFALTGRLPIDAPTAAALVARIGTDVAPTVTSVRSVVPAPLARAVDRCLRRDAADRYASAAEVAAVLRDALAARPETPTAVRRFLGIADAAGPEIGRTFIGSATSLVIMWSFRNDLFVSDVFYTLPPLLATLGLVRLGRVALEARSLVKSGYTLEHVRRAIAKDERDEMEHEPASKRPHVSVRTLGWLAGGIAAGAAGISLVHTDSLFLALTGLAGGIVAPTVAIRRVVRDWLGGRSLLRKLGQGRAGKWLFRLAGSGLKDRPAVRVGGAEPTVVAIARAADQLYLALPDAQRKALGDVPGVIGKLESEALALRGRDRSADREASAVAALESLRLDLLRLSAGGLAKGDLTREIEDAARIGEEIDAHLADRDEPTPAEGSQQR
jgi:serine/threonine-protein kinase